MPEKSYWYNLYRFHLIRWKTLRRIIDESIHDALKKRKMNQKKYTNRRIEAYKFLLCAAFIQFSQRALSEILNALNMQRNKKVAKWKMSPIRIIIPFLWQIE